MKQLLLLFITIILPLFSAAQIGSRFPSERKVVIDPKTGAELIFLTSKVAQGIRRFTRHITNGHLMGNGSYSVLTECLGRQWR